VVEETGRAGENHWSVASQWQTLSHNVVRADNTMTKRKNTKEQTTSIKHAYKTKDWVTRTPLKTKNMYVMFITEMYNIHEHLKYI
jgi:hypothetical protein